ncbi:MAG: helix-turn-helix domain-containing protein [Proteobacteria bacterium]|nr:helix-turn-helix domain-containing protein [Pseudomonadota bacterium]
MGHKLTVSEIEEASMMLADGKSIRSVGRALHKAPSTISKISKVPAVQEKIMKFREQLAGKFETLSDVLITDIPIADIQKMNPYSRVLSSGISIDKASMLRGMDKKPLVTVQIIHLDPTLRPSKAIENAIDITPKRMDRDD